MASDELIGSWLGQYQVLERLGEGGMARVYKGMQHQLNRYVALKIILPEAAERAGFKERFKREAQLIAQLQHTNIVTVYDFGETNNLSYLVMQYVGGGTLSSKLKRGQPLPPVVAANYGVQMARALQHAHGQGIIHRDIKPSNMLLDEKDINHLLLSDFGIAKLLSSASDSDLARRATAADPLTLAGSVLGTPEFMSPEQALAGAIDARADIYSLGMVLYFLLVGSHPFVQADQRSILYHHVFTTPPSASQINPTIPPMLAEVVDQAIAKRPEERFQSADAFARALETALAMMQNDEAPTRLAQPEPTMLAPDVWPGRPSGNAAGAALTPQLTPQLTPTPDRYATNPQPFTMPTTPAPSSTPLPGSIYGPGISAPIGSPSFHSAPTPMPGQPATIVAPPPVKPRRVPLSRLITGISMLVVVAALVALFSPISPFKIVSTPGTHPTATMRAGGTPVTGAVVDMFKVNTNGWPAGQINNDPGLHWTVGNGVYDISITGSQAHNVTYFPSPVNLGLSPTNFTLEIKVQQTQGSGVWGYGLIFRKSSTSYDCGNCYAFTIDSHGQYQFQVYHNDQGSGPGFTDPPSGTLNAGLNQINDLKVVVTGSTFKLYANSHLLPGPNSDNSWTDSSFASGQVGLLVTGDSTQTQEYQFTYFALTPMP